MSYLTCRIWVSAISHKYILYDRSSNIFSHYSVSLPKCVDKSVSSKPCINSQIYWIRSCILLKYETRWALYQNGNFNKWLCIWSGSYHINCSCKCCHKIKPFLTSHWARIIKHKDVMCRLTNPSTYHRIKEKFIVSIKLVFQYEISFLYRFIMKLFNFDQFFLSLFICYFWICLSFSLKKFGNRIRWSLCCFFYLILCYFEFFLYLHLLFFN